MKKFFQNIIYLSLISILIFPSYSLCDDINDDEIINVNTDIISTINIENNIKIPEINSRACVIIDRNSNTILYGKNENVRKKMASTTKIMTAIVIIENCNLADTITVSKKAAATGGSRLGLKFEDKITVHDLLYGLMLVSGNDAAVALAEYASGNIEDFAKLMNNKAKELNLGNTHFETPHGLDSAEHYTTAYELAILANYSLNNKTFAQIVGTKNFTININGYTKNLSNTNELLGVLNGVYGIKTGFTNGANRCLVTACKRNNMDIICVVLGADTKKYRTQDSIKLINYAFDDFEPVNFQELIDNKFTKWKEENIGSFKINKGLSNLIDINVENLENKIIPVRKDFIDSIDISINCQKNFNAPLYDNLEIGNIIIEYGNSNKISTKIITISIINKKNYKDYFLYFTKNFFSIIENSFMLY